MARAKYSRNVGLPRCGKALRLPVKYVTGLTRLRHPPEVTDLNWFVIRCLCSKQDQRYYRGCASVTSPKRISFECSPGWAP